MAGVRLYRVAFLIGVIAVLQILSQKILSSKKRCGDPQCESLMMRASAKQDYTGPDCRFLSFKAGWEINVYYKLAEGREDLWQGSTGKAYGFFPRDTVNVEEVYLLEEVEVPAKEIDFVCLDGGEYFFENEDSVLHSSREHEEDFMDHTRDESREKKPTEGGISTEDSQDDINLKEPAQEVTDKPPWAPSGIAGWFGMGRTPDKQDNTDKAEHIEEDGPAEQIQENNGVQPKEPEDSQPEISGWFGGRLKGFLPFGGKNKQDDTEASSVTSQSASEESVVGTEQENTSSNPQEADQENRETQNIEEAKAKWFNFAIKDVLSFGAKNEKKKEDPSQSVDETGSSERPRQMSPTQEEVSGQCGSGEHSANGYCTVLEGAGQPRSSVQSTEEHCDNVVQRASTYPGLPSAAEMTLFLKKISLQCHDIYNDIIGPVRLACTSSVRKVVSLLPEDLQPGPDFHGCSWEVVIFTVLLGGLSILAFTCRTVRCIKSRCYAGRESKLGDQISDILNSKSQVLEKLSVVQKQYDEVQQTLQESGHQKLLEEIAEQKSLQETLQTSNRELEENITRLEQELEEERERGSELDNTLSELNEKIKALEDGLKSEKSSKEEVRTTQKVFEITQGQMESSMRDAVEEQDHLRESIKQLSKETEGWEERFSELSENSKMLSTSVHTMEGDLSNRQSQVKSLIDSLLKLKDWGSEVEEISKDDDEDGVLASIKWDFENGEPLGAPQKQTIKKLIFAAMLNASLKSVESEKKQLYENLSDEIRAKEHFSECITNLQNTNQSQSLEKTQLEEEMEKLKQKMSVMMEVYQENETKLHRKLTVQEKERIQKEAKLNKADEKVCMAATELVTVRTRLTELEEETERSVASYQGQVTSYEKKSHDNWLTARAAERYLSDVKRETLHLRQKLTEAEYKLELLEKDPFALDVIQAIGRESSPYGLSPISRAQESRAFLSPPTLLEGPLRLSPMLPAGDRGMRPPGYYAGYPGPKERSDVNADRKSDHQRTLSDAGSLSPPWDREQKNNVPPPGLPYPEHHFPPRRPDRFYHYPPPSGRFSGPAELTRNQGKLFVDSLDGRSSPEYKSRGNASRDGPEEANNVPGAPTMEGEAVDGAPTEYPVHPPPPMRVPLLPMDPRAPFFRRPFPMPPPPMDMYGPPGYPGLPPHITMRGPLPPPPQRYPYPMHPEAFHPPQHIHPPPPQNDHPSQMQPAPPPPSDSSASHNLSETQT